MSWVGGNKYLSIEEMKINATNIWNYFGSIGCTVESVSAMLGNMQTESTINPQIWESLTVNYTRGYGLVQWTPATKYINWGGSNYSNGYKQCERIKYEADNGLQWFSNPYAPITSPPLSFAEFLQSSLSPATLANYFLWYYEHPAVTEQPIRGEQANYWYEFLTGVEPTPPDPTPETGKRKLPIWMMLKRRR